MQAYNLLVTFHQNQKGHAEQEVRERLKELGGYVERLDRCDVEGVFLAQVSGDAKILVSQLKRMCHEDPSEFLYTHHWVPIERWVLANMTEMRAMAIEMANGIGPGESWMVHLHKRHFQEHHDELIADLTGPLDRGYVDLEDPDKILVVEIMGLHAGMSLLARHEILDVNKVRVASDIGKV